MPECPDGTDLERDTRPGMLLEKLRDCIASPPSFLTDADEEKHEYEGLKKSKGMKPEGRVELCAKKHREAEGDHGYHDGGIPVQKRTKPAERGSELGERGVPWRPPLHQSDQQ
ncbi:MAG TPA: hypothetical protein VEV41_24570 [Terriglobales bacterium]|nr:hypothetical protein [Terriglobales bacterium]